jgi:tetratricopeptide (TPR) repeat protein
MRWPNPPPGKSSPESEAAARRTMLEAEQLRRAGELGRAQAICERLVQLHPNYVAGIHTLGLILADRGEYAAALPHAVRAVMLNPTDWRGLTGLSGLYLRLNATEMAAHTLQIALSINPTEPSIIATLGEIYREEREYELAAACFESAIKHMPSLVEPKYGLALVYSQIGRLAEATDLLVEILGSGRRPLHAISLLATLPDGPKRLNLDAMLTGVGPGPSEDKTAFECHLAFVEGWLLHSKGQFEAAWRKFARANDLAQNMGRRETDIEAAERLEALRRTKAGGRRFRGPESSTKTVFLLGPSRSGKTTLELLLSGVAGVKRGYESPIVERCVRRASQEAGFFARSRAYTLPPELHTLFRQHFMRELEIRAKGAKVFTNTSPGLIGDAVRLAEALPDVRFVLIKRNPDDLLLRILMQHYRRGNNFAYDVRSARAYIRWYHDMIDALAAQLPAITKIIHYEEMIENPVPILRAVADFCGLDAQDCTVPAIGDDRHCSKEYHTFWGNAQLDS